MKHSSSRWRGLLTGLIFLLVFAMAALVVYIVNWYAERARVQADGRRFQALYVTAAPTGTPVPTGTPAATGIPTPSPSLTPTPSPTRAPLPTAPDELIPTPEADTLVFQLPTAPPVQDSFRALLAENPDTVGFLTLDEDLALPVVQRINDNDYYLDHSFDGLEAKEGALFLDGANRLAPEDSALIVYGHNMKNGTMFAGLSRYASASYLKAHPIVRFDTLYDDRLYAPFAAFTASMDRTSAHYFEVRRFLLSPEQQADFIAELRDRSALSVPLDAAPGDALLLLVTCDYTDRDGRFILALRRLRAGESEADVRAQVAKAQ